MKPVYVAIDTPDVHRAAAIARDVCGLAGGVKLGLEFFCAQWRRRRAPHRRTRTAHLPRPQAARHPQHRRQGGRGPGPSRAGDPHRPRLRRTGDDGGRQGRGAAETKIVAVTVLTSLDQKDLAAAGVDGSPADQVRRLADLARESRGSTGSCVPASEVAAAHEAWPDGFFVVPGVRPAGSRRRRPEAGGHAARALDDGASILVIGRPITDALDPARAIADIAAGLTRTEARI